MSDKELKRFIEDLDGVDSLRSAVEGLWSACGEGGEVPAGALLTLARERGYDIDADDIFARGSAELDDDDLDKVTGGTLRLSGELLGHRIFAGTYRNGQ